MPKTKTWIWCPLCCAIIFTVLAFSQTPTTPRLPNGLERGEAAHRALVASMAELRATSDANAVAKAQGALDAATTPQQKSKAQARLKEFQKRATTSGKELTSAQGRVADWDATVLKGRNLDPAKAKIDWKARKISPGN